MHFVETHCHLDDDAFAEDLPSVVEAAHTAGVDRLVNIGYEPESWARSIELADRFPEISYTLGMHPNSADRWNATTAGELERLLGNATPVGIGEIGLDYFRDWVEPAAQRVALHEQLELANQFRLPVVIHMRGAVENEITSALSAFPEVRAIFHSFDGPPGLRDFAIERGHLIGVGGLMTRASSTELRATLRSVPLESILLETDSPYLTPRGVKERRNTPANLPMVAAHLAELFETTVDRIAELTSANAEAVFRLQPSVVESMRG